MEPEDEQETGQNRDGLASRRVDTAIWPSLAAAMAAAQPYAYGTAAAAVDDPEFAQYREQVRQQRHAMRVRSPVRPGAP